MRYRVDHGAIVDQHHLVDAVGELIAAILDMDRRIGMRQVVTVDVGDARHAGAPHVRGRLPLHRSTAQKKSSLTANIFSTFLTASSVANSTTRSLVAMTVSARGTITPPSRTNAPLHTPADRKR